MHKEDNFDRNFRSFVETLSLEEIDALKYQLSITAVELLNNFGLPDDLIKQEIFNSTIKKIASIQPYRDKIKKYGIVYRGKPSFLTDDLLSKLQSEAVSFRQQAKPNYEQWISPVDTEDNATFAEKLEGSSKLLDFVCEFAGKCIPSYISNYIYYDVEGQNSEPHVDNAFTAVTVMIGLKHEGINKKSSSIIYWPDAEPLEYQLRPGEMTIFFGTTMVHGRTPISKGEEVHSLLLSFRPVL